MTKTTNSSSTIPLTHLNKLNQHIQSMNVQGWELLSVIQKAIGIDEHLIMFWKKTEETSNESRTST